MKIKNFIFVGYGFKKWFWYLFFEVITVRAMFPIEIDGCTFKGFSIYYWESKYFILADYIYKSLKSE